MAIHPNYIDLECLFLFTLSTAAAALISGGYTFLGQVTNGFVDE